MSGSLARFQRDFLRALYHPDDAPASLAALTAQPGYAVYRNTIIKGCIDALQANFPTVSRLVGDEWFRAAALAHVRACPPASVMLVAYGEDFPGFLATFEPARDLPYLPGVARLDRLWTEAHIAADDEPLDAGMLARLSPEALGALAVRPHRAARWIWHPRLPVYAIWRANREQAPLDGELPWHGDGALLTRPRDTVRWREAGLGACAFLDACAAGLPLAEAAQASLRAQPGVDIANLLADLVSSGALAATAPSRSPNP